MASKYLDHRDAAFGALSESLQQGQPLVVLTNDMGAFGLSVLKERFPSRVLNVGIQEQNLVSVASGLALSGMLPVIYGIAAHLIGRSYEQVRLDLAFSNVDALVLSVGPGLTYGADGPTHQALHEVCLLSSLPEVTYWYPTSPEDTNMSVHFALNRGGLQWVSLDKSTFSIPDAPNVYQHEGWKHVHRASKSVVVAYGNVSELGAEVAADLSLDLIQLNQVLPIPTDFAGSLLSYREVILVEEASWPGVLSGMLAVMFGSHDRPRFRAVTLPIRSPLGHWSREAAWESLRANLYADLGS